MHRIAVTGGIACGKSVAGRLLREAAVPVLDADDVAHEVMQPGKPAFRDIVAAFGQAIIGESGEIDRQVLGARVFADQEELGLLNRLVHPRVRERCAAWMDRQERQRCEGVAVIIPLLYEAGFESGWDRVLCVATTPVLQQARLRARGLDHAGIAQRIAVQLPLKEKMKRADVVIFNAGTVGLMAAQLRRTWSQTLERT